MGNVLSRALVGLVLVIYAQIVVRAHMAALVLFLCALFVIIGPGFALVRGTVGGGVLVSHVCRAVIRGGVIAS